MLRLQADEKLVAMIRAGHDRAFEALFDRYQSRLLAFCRHMLRSPQDAEDVLQEVFAAAHTAMLADDRPINARPWLYRIARNRCLNHLRRPDGADGVDSMDVHAHENGTTTLEHVQRREELRAIVRDVQDLPETQRTALVLREIDDLSYTEIAQAMGASMPAVKSLLVRARMSLAECSEARVLTCDEVRLELAEAAEGLGKLGGASRRHVRDCPGCSRYRRELRSSTRAVGALLAPFWLLGLFRKLISVKLGGGSTAGGTTAAGGASGAGAAGTAGGAVGTAGTAAGTAGGVAAAAGGSGITLGGAVAATGAAAGGIGGALGAKAAVGLATAALFTAGGVGSSDLKSDPTALAPSAAASAGVIEAVGGLDALADPPLVAAAPTPPAVVNVAPTPPVIPTAPAPATVPVVAPIPVEPAPAVEAPPVEPPPVDDGGVVIVDPPPVDPPPVDPPPVDPPPVDPPPVDPPPVDPPPVDPPPVDPPVTEPPPAEEPPAILPPGDDDGSRQSDDDSSGSCSGD